MTARTKDEIKREFRDGERPSGSDFGDLIDSFLGIVADSDPAAEHAEVLAKSAALRRALQLAEEGL